MDDLKNKLGVLLGLMALLANLNLQAQTTLSSVVPNLRLERIPSELGLSQNLITCMMQDGKGFLWIGTKDGLNRFDGYKFTVYQYDAYDSTSLSDNFITALLEDRAGRIWVGTQRGLNWFDRGAEVFHRLLPRENRGGPDSANPNGLRHPTISSNSIVEDEYGAIWIGTGDGLSRLTLPAGARNFTGAHFVHFTHDPANPQSLKSPTVNNIVIDDSGAIWLQAPTIYKLVPQGNSGPYTLTAVSCAPADSLWQAALDDPNTYRRILKGRNGKLWICGGAGLICWDVRTQKFTPYRFGDRLTQDQYFGYAGPRGMTEDHDGIIWIGTLIGLVRFDPSTQIFSEYRNQPGNAGNLPEHGLTEILEDRAGVLWFGSNGNGLYRYDPKAERFSRRRRDNQIALWRGASLRGIYETSYPAPEGLWLGFASNRFYRMNRLNGELTELLAPPGIPNWGWMYSMVQDSASIPSRQNETTLWIGASGGFLRAQCRDGRLEQVSFFDPEPDNPHIREVFKVIQDRHGEIWITTKRSLCRFNQTTETFESYLFLLSDDPAARNASEHVFVNEDRNGDFWLGTAEGLLRFDANRKTFERFRNDPKDRASLSHNVVRAILPDPFEPERYLWAGTAGGGLNRFDRQTETFIHFTDKDGLPDNVIYAILDDEEGNLWMSTNYGLSKFNPRTRAFKNFDAQNGLQDNEFNSSSYFKSPSGELFFGGISGFNAFYPKDIQDNPHAPPVVFTGFQILNKPISHKTPDSPLAQAITETREVTLSYEHKVFSFEFAALDFTAPAKNQYAYKMENFDADWQQAGTSRTATYTNLNPGAYVFRVKACNNDGVWNEEGAAIRIIITPPWWRTWWAYGIYVLLLAAGVFTADRFQRRRVIAKERVQTEIREAELRAQAAEAQSKALQAENERKEVELLKAEELRLAYQTLENTLENLKATQQQLVTQQKLASLGQLTAGIAHEIKNPLNFVNNFAALSVDLAKELREEIAKVEGGGLKIEDGGSRIVDRESLLKIEDGGLRIVDGERLTNIKEILETLEQNAEKINHHGKRADGIVKSMMQHARGSSGQRELTDINQLLDEAVNLTYHGMRANDASFNITIEKDYDAAIGKLEVVPQDLSRVFLNIVNNACYAAHQKKKDSLDGFSPTLSVQTKNLGDKIEIRIRDNGNGIPAEVREKIFNPFFTTKPTGQGTGLGLSISYEIIVQQYRGEINVETEEGKFTEFVVRLPHNVSLEEK
jgi:signal transduction histidine kinase/ligand-binding sensor domain-containing protein